MKNLLEKINNKIDGVLAALSSDKALLLLVFAGVAIRARHLLEDCSLWVDESWVAVDVMAKPLRAVISGRHIFDDLTRLPVVFLSAVKIICGWLGNYEMALRLFPFAAAVISLFLFFALVGKSAARKYAIIAMILFVFNDSLIRYSAELKQYSSDVMAALIVLLAADFIKKRGGGLLAGIGLGALWALLLFLSHPVFFVIAGALIALICGVWQRKDYEKLTMLVFSAVFFAGAFLLNYRFSLGSMVNNHSLMQMWTGYFPPAGAARTLEWLMKAVVLVFQNPGGISPAIIGLLLFAAGCLGLYKKDKEKMFILLLPFVLVLVAALFKKYPFGNRLLLFLVPAMIVLATEGLAFLENKSGYLRWILILPVIAFIIFPSIEGAVAKTAQGRCIEDNRGAVGYLVNHYLPGDKIFVSNEGTLVLGYYLQYFDAFERILMRNYVDEKETLHKTLEVGRFFDNVAKCGDKDCMAMDYQVFEFNQTGGLVNLLKYGKYKTVPIFDEIPGEVFPSGRAWILMLHMNKPDQRHILKAFDKVSAKEGEYKLKGASTYLYGKKDF